ncbi:hypothetical protein SHIRM173S_02712 [Streptomyces hirsutus]
MGREAVRPGPGSARGHVRHRRSRCRGGGEADPGLGGRAVRRPGREGGGGVLTAGDRRGYWRPARSSAAPWAWRSSAPSAPPSTATESRTRPGRPWAARRPSPVNRRGERETPRRRQHGRRSPAGRGRRRPRGRWCSSGRRGRRRRACGASRYGRRPRRWSGRRRPRSAHGRRPPPYERRRGNREVPVPPAPSNGRAGCGWISRVRPVPPSGPTWRRSPPRPRPAPRGAPCRRPSGRRGPRRRPRHARPACRRC